MSFDLYVFVKEFPPKTVEKWKQELLHVGLACEFHPTFQTIEGWAGGLLPINVTFTEQEDTEKYSSQSLLAKFEFYVEHEVTLHQWLAEENMKGLPNTMRQHLFSAQKMAFFSKPAGLGVIDLHVQCFAAATLAFLCNSILCDPQAEAYRIDHDLFEGARREVQAYNISELDSQYRYFQSWEEWERLIITPQQNKSLGKRLWECLHVWKTKMP